jgi:hypothetical protein
LPQKALKKSAENCRHQQLYESPSCSYVQAAFKDLFMTTLVALGKSAEIVSVFIGTV